MSAFQQNVTDAIEEGVADIAEGQDALGRKVDARANRIEDEVQNLANEIHNKVVEPHFHITLAQNPGQSAEEPHSPPQHDGDLATWLKKIGLEKFIHKFYDDAGITSLDDLCELDEEGVNEVIGICGVVAGFKKRFIQGLADYKNQKVNEVKSSEI